MKEIVKKNRWCIEMNWKKVLKREWPNPSDMPVSFSIAEGGNSFFDGKTTPEEAVILQREIKRLIKPEKGKSYITYELKRDAGNVLFDFTIDDSEEMYEKYDTLANKIMDLIKESNVGKWW